MIRVDNLTFRYPKTVEPAVRDASFVIERNGIFVFLGPSGSGKSTVQNIMMKVVSEGISLIYLLISATVAAETIYLVFSFGLRPPPLSVA